MKLVSWFLLSSLALYQWSFSSERKQILDSVYTKGHHEGFAAGKNAGLAQGREEAVTLSFKKGVDIGFLKGAAMAAKVEKTQHILLGIGLASVAWYTYILGFHQQNPALITLTEQFNQLQQTQNTHMQETRTLMASLNQADAAQTTIHNLIFERLEEIQKTVLSKTKKTAKKTPQFKQPHCKKSKLSHFFKNKPHNYKKNVR